MPVLKTVLPSGLIPVILACLALPSPLLAQETQPAGAVVSETVVLDDTGEPVRMKNGYPLHLIYGAGNLEEMGCPVHEQPECFAVAARYLHDMGARTTRKTLSWLHTEFEQGTYDWTNPDNSIPYLIEEGYTPVILISDTPVWASHPDALRILEERGDGRFVVCLEIEEEHWDDYEKWLTDAVRRYGEYIDYYEIMNEPDGMCGMYPKYWQGNVGGVGVGGRPEYYAEILKRSAKVIRKEDPTAKISVGGFENKRGLQTDFVEGIYENGAGPYFDAIAIHPYGIPFEEPFCRAWMETVREVMKKYGDEDKPFWITEYNNEGHGELDMSFTVRRKHRLLRETPWITIAIPLGTKYMYYGEDAVNWPLRAMKKMEATEFAPREEWGQDFEAPTIDLLSNWEWRAQPVDDANWPEIELEQETGVDFSTGLHIKGRPTNKRIRACFLPYVASDDPTIELQYAVDPSKLETEVHLRVGLETLDILEPVQESDYVATVAEFNRYHGLKLRVRDHFPELADKGINMFWIEFSTPDPGFSIRIDDVRVY